MPRLPKGLTPRQKIFSKEYVANGYNGTQAAIKAGYSKKAAKEVASRLLTYANIKKYVNDYMQEIEDKLGITIEWKAKMLKRCADRCMPEDEEKRIRPTGMINAIAELNKMQGHYAPTKIDASVREEDEEIDIAREIANKQKREY